MQRIVFVLTVECSTDRNPTTKGGKLQFYWPSRSRWCRERSEIVILCQNMSLHSITFVKKIKPLVSDFVLLFVCWWSRT